MASDASTMVKTSRRPLWILASVALGAVLVAALVLTFQHQQQEHRRAGCLEQRKALSSFKTGVLDARIAQMRQIRLNPSQAQALRETDVKAFINYSALYGQKVEAAAEASERLAELATAFGASGCLELKP